jgi:hypothetical protein
LDKYQCQRFLLQIQEHFADLLEPTLQMALARKVKPGLKALAPL